MYDFVGITDESFLELRSVSQDPLMTPIKDLVTARKRGFFGGALANINCMYTLINEADAESALTRWEWFGEPSNSDAWAWVHGLHFFFGMQTIFSLVVLSLVTYQNFKAGKIWLGDPFSSVSTTTLVTRAALVLIS